MATFYVLPSRHLLGQRCADMLGAICPGIRYTPWDWPDLAEALAGLLQEQGGVHVVYREDLDEELGARDSLMRHFGAELTDEIVEVHFGAGLHQVLHQRWSTDVAAKAA